MNQQHCGVRKKVNQKSSVTFQQQSFPLWIPMCQYQLMFLVCLYFTESLLWLWPESERITCVEIETEKVQICLSADFSHSIICEDLKKYLVEYGKNEDKCAAIIAHSSAGRIYVSNKAAIIFHQCGFKLCACKCPEFITICVTEQKGKAPKDVRVVRVRTNLNYKSTTSFMSGWSSDIRCQINHKHFQQVNNLLRCWFIHREQHVMPVAPGLKRSWHAAFCHFWFCQLFHTSPVTLCDSALSTGSVLENLSGNNRSSRCSSPTVLWIRLPRWTALRLLRLQFSNKSP